MKDILHKYTSQVHTFSCIMKTVFNILFNWWGRNPQRRERLNQRAKKKRKETDTPTHFPIEWSFRKCSWQWKLSNMSSCSDFFYFCESCEEAVWSKWPWKLEFSFLLYRTCKFTFSCVVHSARLKARNIFLKQRVCRFPNRDCQNSRTKIRHLDFIT